MYSPFWHNTIWYILLAFTSIAALLIALKKSSNRRFTFAFWLGVLGFTYCIEVVLVIVLDAYHYVPGLVSDPFQDTILGNIFSQISVSTSALLICVLGLSTYWRIGFSIAYFLIDLLFSAIGVYVHNWYQSIYSLFGFFIYSWIVKLWYSRLASGPRRLVTPITHFLGAFAISGNTIILPQKLLTLQIFKTGIFSDMSKDHTMGSLIYGPVLIFLLMILHRLKAHWAVKICVILIFAVIQYALFLSGFITVMPGWFLPTTAFDLLGFFGWIVLLDRLIRTQVRDNFAAS